MRSLDGMPVFHRRFFGGEERGDSYRGGSGLDGLDVLRREEGGGFGQGVRGGVDGGVFWEGLEIDGRLGGGEKAGVGYCWLG